MQLNLLALTYVKFLVQHFDLHFQLLLHLLHALLGVDLVCKVYLNLVKLRLQAASVGN